MQSKLLAAVLKKILPAFLFAKYWQDIYYLCNTGWTGWEIIWWILQQEKGGGQGSASAAANDTSALSPRDPYIKPNVETDKLPSMYDFSDEDCIGLEEILGDPTVASLPPHQRTEIIRAFYRAGGSYELKDARADAARLRSENVRGTSSPHGGPEVGTTEEAADRVAAWRKRKALDAPRPPEPAVTPPKPKV